MKYFKLTTFFLIFLSSFIVADSASAAITYVGGISASRTGHASAGQALSLTGLTGGPDTTALAGDIVIVACSTGSVADRAIAVSAPTGYAELNEPYANSATDTNFSVSWKIMGVTPDTSVTCGASGNTSDALSAVAQVWRGVDSGTPFDVTYTTGSGTTTGRPTPPAITPSSTGTIIIAIGAGAAAAGAIYTTATLSNFITTTGSDTYDSMLGMGSYAWSSGTYTPAQFGGGTTGGTDSWAADTLALRPGNVDSTLSISLPASGNTDVAEGSSYDVTYTLTDSDSVATVTFYYETDGNGAGGTAITGACATAAEGTGATCSFDTSVLTPGTAYYVYGVTSASPTAVTTVSPGTITVNDIPVLSIAQPASGNTTIATGSSFNVTYTLTDIDDVVTTAFYYDTNNDGTGGVAITGCGAKAEGIGATCSFDTSVLTPGTAYYVYGVTSGDSVNSAVTTVSPGTITVNATPTLSIAQPASGDTTLAEGSSYDITYTLLDTDNIVTTAFYYDTNNDGVGGTSVIGCGTKAEGTNVTCSLNTSVLTPGTAYYIYGVADDSVNSAVTTVSPGTITVNDSPVLSIAQPASGNTAVADGSSYNVTYTLTDIDDVVTTAFYYDTNNDGVGGVAITGCGVKAEGTGATCSFDTSVLTPGTAYYVYGITSGDSINSPITTVSPGTITVNSAPTLSVSDPASGNTAVSVGSSFDITYTLADTDNVVTTAFYYETDGNGAGGTAISGACATAAEGTGVTCSFDTSVLTPGTAYYVYGVVDDSVNSAVTTVSPGTITVTTNSAPTLSVSEPASGNVAVAEGASFDITYTLADTDNVVTAAFYYETDGNGAGGTAISGACATAAEGTGATCSFDTSVLTPGTAYYIYGVVDDGVNSAVTTVSPGTITVNDSPVFSISLPASGNIAVATGSSFNVTYTLTDIDDVVTTAFYYDTNNDGTGGVAITGCGAKAEGTGSTCSFNTSVLTPGTAYYVYGITSGDSVNSPVTTVSPGTITTNAAPTLSISAPVSGNTAVAEGASYDVTYTLTDSDSVATVTFYYDTNNDGTGGVAITGCGAKAEGTGSTCSFNTSVLTPGTAYYVYGVVDDGVNSAVTTVSPGTITVNSAPTLSISLPASGNTVVLVGSSFDITYTLSDTDNVVTAAFYYDTNNDGTGGVAITGACATAAEGTGATCSFDTSVLTPGTAYYVYSVVDDGVNSAVTTVSPGTITVNAAPTLSISLPASGNTVVLVGSSFDITYTLSDTDNVVTAAFYYDTNNDGTGGVAITGCGAKAEGTGATCSFNTSVLTPGTAYYVYGVTSGDSVNSAVTTVSPGTITVSSGGITISGISDMRTGSTVRVAVSGVLDGTHTGTISAVTGNWSIASVAATGGNSIIVFVEDGTEANESTGITLYDGTGDIANMVLDANVLSIGNPDNQSLDLSNVDDYQNSDNENVMHSVITSTLTVDGGNSYSAEKIDILSGNTLTVSGTETLATYDATITGVLTSGGNSIYNIAHNFTNNGTFTQSTSTVNMSGSTAQVIGGSTTTAFNNLTLSNTGAAVSASTDFSAGGNLTINASAILSPAAAVIVSGAGTLTGNGTVQVSRTVATPDFSSQYTITNKTYTNLTVGYVGSSAQTVSDVTYGHLKIGTTGGAMATLAGDTDITGDLTISAGGTLATGSDYAINLGGNWNNAGNFTSNNSTVTFNASTTGKTIVTGGTGTNQDFYAVVFNHSAGGWTIQTNNLLANNNFTITDTANSAGAFTVNSVVVEVKGTYSIVDTETANTAWTSATLYLNSASAYTVGSKTQENEDYSTLQISANTDIRMWNSSAVTSTVAASGSLYSQDYNSVDGDVYIWGDYHVPTNDYWSYATDFDGTSLGGSSRQVDVQIDNTSTVTIETGDTLAVIGGTSPHMTIVGRLGYVNGYNMIVDTGTINFQYTDFEYLNGNKGLDIRTGSTVTSLDNCKFNNLIGTGNSDDAFITVASTVIGSAQKTLTNVQFDNSGSGAELNVNRTGSDDTGYWNFVNSTGSFDGEVYDGSGGSNEADPGMIRWVSIDTPGHRSIYEGTVNFEGAIDFN